MSVKTSTKDNTDEVLKRMEKAFERGLKACGITAEAYAKDILTDQVYSVDESKLDYVLTGRLRNSITYAIGGKSAAISHYEADKPGYEGGSYSGTVPEEDKPYVAVGTNVKYAIGIEEGTHRKKGAVHFLLKAASEHQEEYEKLIKESMENA